MQRMITSARRVGGDRIAATILLLVSVGLLVTSLGYQLAIGSAPGPGLFPAIIATALVVLSLLWLVTGAGAQPQAEHATPDVTMTVSDAPPEDDDDVVIDQAGARRIAFVVAWTLLPLLLMERAGYVVAITLYVAGLLAVIARVRPWVAVGASLLGALVSHIGASQIGVVLPDPFRLLNLLGL